MIVQNKYLLRNFLSLHKVFLVFALVAAFQIIVNRPFEQLFSPDSAIAGSCSDNACFCPGASCTNDWEWNNGWDQAHGVVWNDQGQNVGNDPWDNPSDPQDAYNDQGAAEHIQKIVDTQGSTPDYVDASAVGNTGSAGDGTTTSDVQTGIDTSSCGVPCGGCGGFCGYDGGKTCNQMQKDVCGQDPCYLTGSCAQQDLSQLSLNEILALGEQQNNHNIGDIINSKDFGSVFDVNKIVADTYGVNSSTLTDCANRIGGNDAQSGKLVACGVALQDGKLTSVQAASCIVDSGSDPLCDSGDTTTANNIAKAQNIAPNATVQNESANGGPATPDETTTNARREANADPECGGVGQQACSIDSGLSETTNICDSSNAIDVNTNLCVSVLSFGDAYPGLTPAEFRDLSDRCKTGIDVDKKRCLPATPLRNGEMNLGTGSQCDFGSQCQSDLVCTVEAGCQGSLQDKFNQFYTIKPQGDSDAYYRPTNVILVGHNKDVTLIRDLYNTSGDCTDNYDCAVGHRCVSGVNKCAPDSYSCGSNSNCPQGWSCGGAGICEQPGCSDAQVAACGNAGCILVNGNPVCTTFDFSDSEQSLTGTGGTGSFSNSPTTCADGSPASAILFFSGNYCESTDNGAPVIYQNRQDFTPGQINELNAAINGGNPCYQADLLDANGNFCGIYQGAYTCGDPACANQDVPPGSPPGTPPGTPPVDNPTGPMCLSLSLNNLDKPVTGDQATQPDPEIGDRLQFTCGDVAEADHYEFRIINQTTQIPTFLSATGRTSEVFTVQEDGSYTAQCRICTGPDASSCHAWEGL